MALPFELNETMISTMLGVALAAGAWLGCERLFDRRFRHETDSAYGTAHWAKERDLKQAGLFGSDGIVLGRHRGKLLRHRTDRHLLTLAPNRAGKGVSSIMPNLLTWQGSVLVIDPKGENAIVTARRRREMGQKVHVLDPWGITGLEGGRFNPLLALAPDSLDLSEDAALLADGLVLPGAKADDEFWNGEARSLLAGLLMHIVTTELPEDRHLGALRAMLTLGEQEFADLLDDMLDNHAASGLVARTARRLLQKTDRERSGVISTAQAQTHFLDSPRMTAVLGASSFDPGDLKSGGMTIYLVLPADRLATHGRWLRLVVGLCLAALTRDLQAVETAMGLLAGFARRGERLGGIHNASLLLANRLRRVDAGEFTAFAVMQGYDIRKATSISTRRNASSRRRRGRSKNWTWRWRKNRPHPTLCRGGQGIAAKRAMAEAGRPVLRFGEQDFLQTGDKGGPFGGSELVEILLPPFDGGKFFDAWEREKRPIGLALLE